MGGFPPGVCVRRFPCVEAGRERFWRCLFFAILAFFLRIRVSLFGRYAAAMLVAFIVSFTIFFLGAALLAAISKLSNWIGVVGMLLLFIAVGFCGVFSGVLCLEQLSRRFGS